MDPKQFLTGRTRETSIERDARGRWFFEGAPLTHPNLVRSFNEWIGRAEDGRYCLSNDINWAYITLSGPPHFVRSARVKGEGAQQVVELHLSNGRIEALRVDTLRQDADGGLYCDVGTEPLSARFDSAAATALSTLLGEDGDGVYIEVAGRRVYPPTTDTPVR